MDEKHRPGADGFERAEVERLAQLARLRLSEDEVTRFAGQLARILAYAETVREADTSDVLPTSHPLPEITGRLREDATAPSLSRDDAIAASPDADADRGLFIVPRVL